MIKPKRLSEVVENGWYMHLDFEHQKGPPHWGTKPYGGWFYELTPEGWRNEVGCLDTGPFDETDLFIGPISLVQEL